MVDVPSQARVVIVGGGIVGCSIAYHLVKRGVSDVVLLERRQLTCGTTWHAAGLVGQLRATQNLTRLAQYTTNLFSTLEAETGQATGFRARGSVSVATNTERFEELRRSASTARCFGLEVNVVSRDEIAAMFPLGQFDDVVGGVHLPNDGITNPIDTTQALGQRCEGRRRTDHRERRGHPHRGRGRSGRRCRVLGRRQRPACCVPTPSSTPPACGPVISATRSGSPCRCTPPSTSTSSRKESTASRPTCPCCAIPDGCGYFKEEAGKLMVGWFEPVAKPWGMSGIPEAFCFDSLPADYEHIAPLVDAAVHRMPILGETGIRLFFNGPESFTPDDRYLLGETPEVAGLYLACGFNSIGIQSSGGAGKVLADWIVDGHPPMDLWDVDARRSMPFQRNRRYLHDRTVESLGLLYAMHWPFFQPTTARGVRRSVVHDRLADRGACFGEVAGWERANWFAPDGVDPVYEYSYGRQNWFDHSAAEHHATRNAVALFDQSSFGKFVVEGADACRVLNQVCANDVDVAVGRVVYTQWLNERGGIEADLTVTRESETRYLVVTAAATQTRDLAYLRRHIGPDDRGRCRRRHVGVRNLRRDGAELAGVAAVADSRTTSATTRSHSARHARSTSATPAFEPAASRTSASWDGSCTSPPSSRPACSTRSSARAMTTACGSPATTPSTRCGWRRRTAIGVTTSPPTRTRSRPASVSRSHGTSPAGSSAAPRRLRRASTVCTSASPSSGYPTTAPLMYHNEPIWRDGVLVGRITSGMFGHTVDAPLGMGYVSAGSEFADGRVDRGRHATRSKSPANASPRKRR